MYTLADLSTFSPFPPLLLSAAQLWLRFIDFPLNLVLIRRRRQNFAAKANHLRSSNSNWEGNKFYESLPKHSVTVAMRKQTKRWRGMLENFHHQ